MIICSRWATQFNGMSTSWSTRFVRKKSRISKTGCSVGNRFQQALIEPGQAPLVFNEVKSTIDWIIGTERRTRVD